MSPLLPACPTPDPVLLEQGCIGDQKTEEANPAKVEPKVGEVCLVQGLIDQFPRRRICHPNLLGSLLPPS